MFIIKKAVVVGEALRQQELINGGQAIDFNLDIMRGDPDLELPPLHEVLSNSYGTNLRLFELHFPQADSLIFNLRGEALFSGSGYSFDILIELAGTPMGRRINEITINQILDQTFEPLAEDLGVLHSRDRINRYTINPTQLEHSITINFFLDSTATPKEIYEALEKTMGAVNIAIAKIHAVSKGLYGSDGKKIYDTEDLCVHPGFYNEP